MSRLDEVQQDVVVRRRSGAIFLGLATVLVVALGAWYATGAVRAEPAPPASPAPTTGASAGIGQTVGHQLPAQLTFNAPAGWAIDADAEYVWLTSDTDEQVHIEVGGPVTKVWNPASGKAQQMRHGLGSFTGRYEDWLRGNPSVTVLEDSPVVVDGVDAHLITYRVDADAPIPAGQDGPIFAWADGGWSSSPRGAIVSEVVLEVQSPSSQLWLVRAAGAQTNEERDRLRAALDVVLSTLAYAS